MPRKSTPNSRKLSQRPFKLGTQPKSRSVKILMGLDASLITSENAVPLQIPRVGRYSQELFQDWGEEKRSAFIADLTADRIRELTVGSEMLEAFSVVSYELASRLWKTGNVDRKLWSTLVTLAERSFESLARGARSVTEPYSAGAHTLHAAYVYKESWRTFLELAKSESSDRQRQIIEALVPSHR